MGGVGATDPGWSVIDGDMTAWFDARSLSDGAAFAARVVDASPASRIRVRSTGIEVRLGGGEHMVAVSAAAAALGLTADPTAPQRLTVVVESPDPARVWPFWQRVLGDDAATPERSLGRVSEPVVIVRESTEARPLRSRLHLDVVRPMSVVERIGLGTGSGPYGVCHHDADGNEVDVVPGDPLSDGPNTADWQMVFAASATYRTTSPPLQGELVTAAASIADAAGFPLLIDVRPGLVVLDTGKDRWDAAAHGLDVDVVEIAADLQSAARELGAVADPSQARFVQIGIDAADVEAVRAFWGGALGYVHDRRPGLTDIHDPRWLDPVLIFQGIDESDTARRRQRNRIHLELAVPIEAVSDRVDTAIAAGGRVLDRTDGRWTIADPEGNELVIVGG